MLDVFAVGRAAWDLQIAKYPECAGALKRAREVDLNDLALMMAATRDARGSVFAARVAAGWSDWYGEFVVGEAEALVRERGDAEARTKLDKRLAKRKAAMVDLCCDVLAVLRSDGCRYRDLRRSVGGVSVRKLDGALAALRSMGAVRIVAGGRVVPALEVSLARAYLLELRADLFDDSAEVVAAWESWGSFDDQEKRGVRHYRAVDASDGNKPDDYER